MQQLLGGPRAALDADVVTTVLEHTGGTKARHGVTVLQVDGTPLPGASLDVEGGEVRWAYRPPDSVDELSNDAAEVRRTATLTVGPTDLALESYRYLIWTELQAPDGTWVRFHLGVFISTNPPITDDGLTVRRPLKLADKTYRYRRELTEAIVVDAGENPVDYVIADLTSRFGETAFSMPATTVELTEAMAFPAGSTTFLGLYNALLEVAAYDQLTCDEDGRPRSVPLATLAGQGPEWRYGPGEGKILTPGEVAPLIEHLPNVVRFVARQGPSLAEEGNGIVTVRNQSTGPASIDQRGEEVEIRVEVDAEGQDELEAIAAADAQRWFAGGGLRYTGQVALNPLHSDRDVIALTKPRLGLAGTWLVTEWSYPLQLIETPDAVLMHITAERRI